LQAAVVADKIQILLLSLAVLEEEVLVARPTHQELMEPQAQVVVAAVVEMVRLTEATAAPVL
jgi:hypothetical protein